MQRNQIFTQYIFILFFYFCFKFDEIVYTNWINIISYKM